MSANLELLSADDLNRKLFMSIRTYMGGGMETERDIEQKSSSAQGRRTDDGILGVVGARICQIDKCPGGAMTDGS